MFRPVKVYYDDLVTLLREHTGSRHCLGLESGKVTTQSNRIEQPLLKKLALKMQEQYWLFYTITTVYNGDVAKYFIKELLLNLTFKK